MLTLTAFHKSKLEKALDRADGMEIIETAAKGVYFVQSTSGNTYQVNVVKEAGQVHTSCSCPAGQHDLVCKHLASVLLVIKTEMQEKRAALAAA